MDEAPGGGSEKPAGLGCALTIDLMGFAYRLEVAYESES